VITDFAALIMPTGSPNKNQGQCFIELNCPAYTPNITA
jgi:hypothetical protein